MRELVSNVYWAEFVSRLHTQLDKEIVVELERFNAASWRRAVRQHEGLLYRLAQHMRDGGWALPYTHFILLGYWPRRVK